MRRDQPLLREYNNNIGHKVVNLRWLFFTASAITVRFCTFGHPVVHVDESFYFLTAHLWSQGALPFVDVWDRKPLGLFILYLPAASLGMHWGLLAYQAMALVFAVATAELIARFADRADWSGGALPAGLTYLLWLNLLEGQGGQAPVFYNLTVIAAATILAPRKADPEHPDRRFMSGAAAMLIIGVALQIKYSVIFEGLYLGCWWVWRERALGRQWRYLIPSAIVLAALAAAPTLIVWVTYWRLGHGCAFAYANFLSIVHRHSGAQAEQLGNFLYLAAMLSPLTVAAVATFRQPCPDRVQQDLRDWLFGWLAASLFGVYAFGGWFEHYALAALPPLCVFAAGFAAQHPRGKQLVLPFVAVSLVAGQIVVVAKLWSRGSISEYAAIAKVIGHGNGCLYVYSGEAIFYAYSHRCRVTRYLFPSHLGRASEAGAIGTDQLQEVRKVFVQRPQLVMMADPYIGEDAAIRRSVVSQVQAAYRLKAAMRLGSRTIKIFERRVAPGAMEGSDAAAD